MPLQSVLVYLPTFPVVYRGVEGTEKDQEMSRPSLKEDKGLI